jgi:hypothetical protein
MSHNLHLIVVIVLQRFLEEKFEEDQEGEREREREIYKIVIIVGEDR